MQRKMKRLTEGEIRKELIVEYKELEAHINNIRGQLRLDKDLTEKEKHALEEIMESYSCQEMEVINIWARLFNKEFSKAFNEILDIMYPYSINQQVSA